MRLCASPVNVVVIACLQFGVAATAADVQPRPPEQPPQTFRAKRATPGIYAEAVSVIRQQAMFLNGGEEIDYSLVDTAEKLKSYLARRDFFSDFLTREEYEKLRQTQRPRYAGIGLELEKKPSGDIICYPFASGPAAKAGIRSGDRLIAIDGQGVRGKSLPTLVAAAGGKVNTVVRVEIAGKDGRRRQVSITRATISPTTTYKARYGGVSVMRLSSFTQNTKNELAYLLSTLDPGSPVIIDLRGNSGGDLHGAIDTAMLFLAHGEAIVSVRSRTGVKRYASTLDRGGIARRVILWQDEFTASAAEVFIAALTENRRAESVGRKSFGKGTRQDVIELSNGDTLILTTGYLQTPSGIEFNGRGLEPNFAIVANKRTADYLKRTAELVAQLR